MRTTRKIIATLLTAGVVSSAAIGSAFADFPRQSYGDLSGDEPLSVRQMHFANERALRAVRGNRVQIVNPSATADFPRQAHGDLNGEERVPVRELTNARQGGNVLILPFLGDWNGTAKSGFPHH